jgi:signal peptidase I
MTKNKLPVTKSRRVPSQSARTELDLKQADASWFSSAAIRETVESVIIAFVLAFLFRTFEAEAFVIPTGSMAPTLMGKHKDVECPMCHYRYPVSASDAHTDRDHPDEEVAATIYHSTCPMCRFTARLTPDDPRRYPTYDGDRILVAKFPYEFAEPKRWDVIVFKYPGNATMNYIKRLVGLPGETIQIHDGDLWIQKPGQDHFEIARKPPEKLLAMRQLVYDNDLAPAITGELGWPARWTNEPGFVDNSWRNKEDLASFESDGNGKGEAWVRYRHRVPTPDAWQNLAEDAHKRSSPQLAREEAVRAAAANPPSPDSVPPQLISDATAYNTGDSDKSEVNTPSKQLLERGGGLHWVGDLAVEFNLESKSASGKVVAELVKGGHRFQCRFDLGAGTAELAIGGDEPVAREYHRTAKTAVAGVGAHKIIFANFDDELTLWVDGKVVAFSDPGKPAAAPPPGGQASDLEQHPNQYDSVLLGDHVPTADDLSPAGIAADGAAVKVSHLKVWRDVYYIATFCKGNPPEGGQRLIDFVSEQAPDLTRSSTWAVEFRRGNMKRCTITLDPANPAQPEKDRFFVLGDNSAQSSDGRLWRGEYWVERELLIGKALFIYWPHGWGIPYVPLPFNPVPNFGRMHLVR